MVSSTRRFWGFGLRSDIVGDWILKPIAFGLYLLLRTDEPGSDGFGFQAGTGKTQGHILIFVAMAGDFNLESRKPK